MRTGQLPFELFIGLRYLRARGRNRFISFISLISMLGIALGVAVLIVVLSVMNGFERELRERILNMTAHATITGYGDALPDWRAVAEFAAGYPQVQAAAPYIEGQGLLLAGQVLSGVALRGIEPALEAEVAGIDTLMVEGSLDALQAGQWRIVLGEELARALDVSLGERVILVIPEGSVTPLGLMPRMRSFTVSGIFRAGMFEFDRSIALLHIADAQRLYRLGERATGVRLAVTDIYRAGPLVREIALDYGGGVYIDDWTRRHANFFRSIQLTKTIMFVILLLVVAVAAFNIVSTLVMVVRDKQTDISILRTLGASPRHITSIFIVQGTVIGVVGTLLGVLLGALLAVNLERLIAGVERLLDTKFLAADVYFISDLPAQLQWQDLLAIAMTALVLSLISTLYPAWRAARTQPAEALRHD
ncbi:MAG: lipoprotein-releasing ABC transporter permease subunit [Gammaproteobacteria bacterium]|nr:lipoprotein-releasing ABC transporter permease subunit [Gammaproteobacteria bacterium]